MDNMWINVAGTIITDAVFLFTPAHFLYLMDGYYSLNQDFCPMSTLTIISFPYRQQQWLLLLPDFQKTEHIAGNIS